MFTILHYVYFFIVFMFNHLNLMYALKIVMTTIIYEK